MSTTRTPKRVSIMEEFARRIGNLSRVRGCQYIVPDGDEYFDNSNLPQGAVYDGSEREELNADYNGMVRYTLAAIGEIAFEYTAGRLALDGNDLLAEYRIMLAQANRSDDQLDGRIFSIAGVLSDIHSFPCEQLQRRGRLMVVASIVYHCPASDPYWPQSA